jgi:hypothetical protein
LSFLEIIVESVIAWLFIVGAGSKFEDENFFGDAAANLRNVVPYLNKINRQNL